MDVGVILDALPALIWITFANGNADFVNRQWPEYTGLNIEEARGLGWQRAVHPEDLYRLQSSWAEAMAAGEPRAADARLRRADGEYRWFSLQPSRVSVASEHWCWLVHDADQQLPDLNRGSPTGSLRRFLDMLPTQVVFMTPSLEVEFVNREVLDYTVLSSRSCRSGRALRSCTRTTGQQPPNG